MSNQPYKTCHRCGQNAVPSTVHCRRCGELFADAIPHIPVPRYDSQSLDKAAKGIGIGLVLLVLYILGSLSPKNSDIEVLQMSREFVKDRLFAPSTASFSSLSDSHVIKAKDGQFVVTGWVEAKNAFGVPLRQIYVARMIQKDKDHWALADLEIVGR